MSSEEVREAKRMSARKYRELLVEDERRHEREVDRLVWLHRDGQIDLASPTEHGPCSKGKIAVLAARLALELPLFVAGDEEEREEPRTDARGWIRG